MKGNEILFCLGNVWSMDIQKVLKSGSNNFDSNRIERVIFMSMSYVRQKKAFENLNEVAAKRW